MLAVVPRAGGERVSAGRERTRTANRRWVALGVSLLTAGLVACGGGGGTPAAPGDDAGMPPPDDGDDNAGINSAPVISGVPDSFVLVGERYQFLPSANDADGDALTFSIDNRPNWASFSPSTGELSGEPEAGDVGTYRSILIEVSDGEETVALNPFLILVDAPNTAPTIGGTPATEVVAAESYRFVPDAQDADGDTLTFSIDNAPSWANFSSATGELSGVPQASDVGSYAGITISVSDGVLSASLAPFTIEVMDAGGFTATLSWEPPTQNTDDTALTDLAGYRIYYGLAPGDYTELVDVDNAGLSSFVVGGLPAGTYYFTVTAVNALGIESDFADEVSASLP